MAMPGGRCRVKSAPPPAAQRFFPCRNCVAAPLLLKSLAKRSDIDKIPVTIYLLIGRNGRNVTACSRIARAGAITLGGALVAWSISR